MRATNERNWQNLTLKDADEAVQIHILDEIGAGWFGGVTAADFRDALAVAEGRPLDLYINSPGGSVNDGVAMFNMLSDYPGRVHSYVIGEAASIASVIPQAADKVFARANTRIMIHDPWVIDGGNAADKRKMADLLDMVKDQILDTYLVRATASRKELSDMMARETWLNADQALAVGLVDEVLPIGREKAATSWVRFEGVYEHIPSDALQDAKSAWDAIPVANRKQTYNEKVKSEIELLRADDLKFRMRRQREEFERNAKDIREPVSFEAALRREINNLKVRS
jgi:ATP-dependent Clp protease, protease subunit